jgi:hypothetical protein
LIFDIGGDLTGVFSYIAVPGSIEYLLYSGYTVFSILSFVLTWLATAFLLYPYSKKFGRIKYWTIISLPLVYFLSQFPSVFLDLFTPLLNSDPIFYGIFLSVIFTLSKAAGGILFGAAFWTMSRNTPHVALRDYLVIAAIGFVLLFVSDQGLVLLSVPYPPLGLASVSFMGL